MDFRDAVMTCKLVLSTGAVPLVVGETGIGKTALAREISRQLDAHLIVIDANILKEGEIGGLPTVEDYTVELRGEKITRRRTTYAVHTKLLEVDQVLERDPEKKILLFLDELNRCEHAVQQELMNLILNREINGYNVPSNVLMLAAMNPSNKYESFSHSFYQVVEMDPAQEDRFVWLELEANVKAWLAWGLEHEIHSDVLDFIATFPEFLHTINGQEAIAATPRSWERVSRTYSTYCSSGNYPEKILYNAVKGNVGSAVAQDFLNFINTKSNPLVQPQEIFKPEGLQDQIIEKIKNDNHSRLFLVARNSLRYIESESTDKKRDVAIFTQLLEHFPSDLRMAIMQEIKAEYAQTLYPLFIEEESFVDGFFQLQQAIG
ncbi:hypothetical protein GGQ84_000056 [Desulfitispora alkaliphila]|uniref:AAA family ATPase n=1 Tax=Desulfitispora alkaliphila TaxID=622674 RepID=UPI003D1FDAE2